MFLVTYCLVASFTEDGLGSAASYMFDLTLTRLRTRCRGPR
jgi:hypothetical protein